MISLNYILGDKTATVELKVSPGSVQALLSWLWTSVVGLGLLTHPLKTDGKEKPIVKLILLL